MPNDDPIVKRLWLIVPVVLALLIPILVQSGSRAPSDPEPIQVEEVGTPAPSGSPARTPTPRAALSTPPAPPAPFASGDGEDASEAFAELDCVIEPWEMIEIGSQVEGLIEAIHVDRADRVEVGDVLVELDAGVEAATVEVARARAEAEGEVLSRQVSLELGERRKRRMDELFAREAISLDIQDEVETDARLASHELLAAREKRVIASLEFNQAIEILERRTIRSPVSGYVVERRMAPGEVVDDETILTIAQVDPLRVEVIAPSNLYGAVDIGTRAEVIPELPPGARFEAEVTLVDRVIDAASGTFGLRLELENPDHSIPGGLRCRVRFLPDAPDEG